MINLDSITEREHNILIVDTEKDKIKELQNCLDGNPYLILDSAPNVLEAIMKTKDAFYDVVLLNYTGLPDNGQQFLKELKVNSPNTISIATTDEYDEELEDQILNEGVYAIFDRTSIRPPRIQATVRNAINLRGLQIDGKTGFYTDTMLFKRLKEEIERLAGRRMVRDSFETRRKESSYFSLLMLDIDNFKEVNDTYGHIEGGDIVLRRIAEEIRVNTRPNDICGRYGGDELVVGLIGHNYELALERAGLLRQNIENLGITSKDGRIIPATVSIGLATIPNELIENTVEGAMEAADKALYRAKELGKNYVVGYSASLNKEK